MHSTLNAVLEVIEGEARQVTYRLNCSGEFTRARFGHSEVFKKITSGIEGEEGF
jgi:hypothetical protein